MLLCNLVFSEEHNDLIDEINMKNVKLAGPFLDGCSVSFKKKLSYSLFLISWDLFLLQMLKSGTTVMPDLLIFVKNYLGYNVLIFLTKAIYSIIR